MSAPPSLLLSPFISLDISAVAVAVQGIIETTGNARFAYDTYRRFLNMYSDVVMDMDREPFEEVCFGSHRSCILLMLSNIWK